jgi:hypothetical protein
VGNPAQPAEHTDDQNQNERDNGELECGNDAVEQELDDPAIRITEL